MEDNKTINSIDIIKKWLFIGVPIIFLLGALMHFAFEFTGDLKVVGAIAPVNESIWEHLKLSVHTTILWGIIMYFALRNKIELDTKKLIVGIVTSCFVSMIFVVVMYYTDLGAFRLASFLLDISSLIIGVFLGQLSAFHIYKYANINKIHAYISSIMIILLLMCFAVFTFKTPEYPLFIDNDTQHYGILKEDIN